MGLIPRHNSPGAVARTSAPADFAAYEQLPPQVREVIREAPGKIMCQSVLDAWHNASLSGATVGEFIDWLKPQIEATVKASGNGESTAR